MYKDKTRQNGQVVSLLSGTSAYFGKVTFDTPQNWKAWLEVPSEGEREREQGHCTQRSCVNEAFVLDRTPADQISGDNQRQWSV